MSFYIEDEFGEEVPEELEGTLKDIEKQIQFHKDKLLTANTEHIEDVLKALLVNLIESVDEEKGNNMMPLLTAMIESFLELRETNDILFGELIGKKTPPPKDFGIN